MQHYCVMTNLLRPFDAANDAVTPTFSDVVLASDAEAAIAAAEQRGYQAGHEAAVAGSLTHACPPSGSGIMPCCGRTPFEVPRDDRMTLEPSRVTCNAFQQGQRDALAAAVQRVEALLDQGDCPDCSFTSRDQQIVAAIKGEQA